MAKHEFRLDATRTTISYGKHANTSIAFRCRSCGKYIRLERWVYLELMTQRGQALVRAEQSGWGDFSVCRTTHNGWFGQTYSYEPPKPKKPINNYDAFRKAVLSECESES